MGWEYSLVDANWDLMQGGTLEELAAYASDRGVGLLVWYNSGGPINEITERPRDRMHLPAIRRAEFQRLRQLGVKGVKVDFFQSDKQGVIQLYLDILRDAADHHLLVNFHGCTLPRGWERTFPNLVTMEAVRGGEAYRFDERYPTVGLVHQAILPFTRNVVGPMDFTPVGLSDSKYPHLSSYAFELALAVVFESGVQHYCDSPAAYRALPEFARRMLREVPAAWEETRFLSGYPGESAILARRAGRSWYVGAINATAARSVALPLDFLESGSSYTGELITSARAPRQLEASVLVDVDAADRVDVALPAQGGAVLILRPAHP